MFHSHNYLILSKNFPENLICGTMYYCHKSFVIKVVEYYIIFKREPTIAGKSDVWSIAVLILKLQLTIHSGCINRFLSFK